MAEPRERLGGTGSKRQGGRYGGRHDQKWNVRYRELEDFKAEHGHCSVPRSHGPLGRWVANQRKACRTNDLSEERVEELDALGFNWGTTRDTPPTWDERLGELAKYKAEHGLCSLQSQSPLGTWVSRQRAAYMRGKLSEERIQKIEELGFVWKPLSTQPTWDERLVELTEYKAEHGDCKVSTSQGPLGIWVNNQRSAYKKGKLSKERVQKLEDLGFIWGRGTIPNSDRCTTRRSRPKIDVGEEEDSEEDGGRERKRRSALPQSTTHKSDTSDQEDLIPSDEVAAVTVTVLADAEADRGNLKPGSLRPDSVPSSGPNHGDDETGCTNEGKHEEYDNRCADDGDDDMNEHTTGRDGALLARIKTLEVEVARLEAENVRMKLIEATNAILEAENASLRKKVNVN